MPKKRGRHNKPSRKGPTRPHRIRTQGGAANQNADDDLGQEIAEALNDDHPYELIAHASTMIAALDPRGRNPFERSQPSDEPTVDMLINAFIGIDTRETTALLAACAPLITDVRLRTAIIAELPRRTHDVPDWVRVIEDVHVTKAFEMVHVLADGDNVMLGATIAGFDFTFNVYIDHNAGTVVKDAFPVPQSIDEVRALYQSQIHDDDTQWNEIPLADAKVRITEAIERGAQTIPPFESDSWPACRPLVEWIARELPDGGTGYDHPEWTEHQLTEIEDRFLSSEFGTPFDTEDGRDMLGSLLWYSSGYGPCDPLRWSPTSVEILLLNWLPRKVIADAKHLATAPSVLRAFVRFCHAERAITPALTETTIAGIDAWEPEYLELIRSPRPQGPFALREAMNAFGATGPGGTPAYSDIDDFGDLGFFEDLGLPDPVTTMLDGLATTVGGNAVLDTLNVRPLPNEPFRWDGIAPDTHERVQEVLTIVDDVCDRILDVEHRTAARRFLARVATGDPTIFRRKGRADTAAAAVVWVIGKDNDLFRSTYLGGIFQKDFLEHFGMKGGSINQRAATLLKAAGIRYDGRAWSLLQSTDYLVSARRRTIIECRDRYRAMADDI